jgi:AraC-like DNA-binding protein
MEAVSPEQYRAQPVGRYFFGPTYVVWWRSMRLNGILMWGRPEEEHILSITRALDAELMPWVLPHASLIDTRRVWGVDAAAFNALLKYVASRSEVFSRLVQRQAVVRPEGFAGAAIAGFYTVLTPSFPVSVFTDAQAGVDWLGLPEESSVCAELDGLADRLNGGSVTVVQLRALLERCLGSASIARAALALGLSERSLQRQLCEAGTSFRAELNFVQVQAAKGLMLDTTHDLKRVASEVGCASLQNFSSLFKRVEGSSPSEWRSLQRPRSARSSELRRAP